MTFIKTEPGHQGQGLNKLSDHLLPRRHQLRNQLKTAQKKGRQQGQQKIGGRPRQRHPHHVALRIAQVVEIDRHRTRPSEAEHKKGDGPDGVEVAHRIGGQPSKQTGGRIPEFLGGKTMGDFVKSHGQKSRDKHD